MPDTDVAVEVLREEVEKDGKKLFVISAVTGEGIEELVSYTARKVAELRAQAAEQAEPQATDLGQVWAQRRARRDRTITVTREDGHAWRVSGTDIERMVVQTDWENDEAVDYLQHRFQRLKLEETLLKAGCVAGDEVRILGYAFDFELSTKAAPEPEDVRDGADVEPDSYDDVADFDAPEAERLMDEEE
jgi:GTP-binding protein